MDWRAEVMHWWRWGPHDPAIVWSGLGGRVSPAEVEAYCDALERAERDGPWQALMGSHVLLYGGLLRPGR